MDELYLQIPMILCSDPEDEEEDECEFVEIKDYLAEWRDIVDI